MQAPMSSVQSRLAILLSTPIATRPIGKHDARVDKDAKLRYDMTIAFFLLECKNPPIAQLVEQIALNDKIVGSNPTGRTRKFLKSVAECGQHIEGNR